MSPAWCALIEEQILGSPTGHFPIVEGRHVNAGQSEEEWHNLRR